MVHSGALGALLTLSPTLWYRGYADTTWSLGLDPLADQQIGGLLMWVPAGFAYFGSGLVVALRWLDGRDRRSRLRQA